MRAILITLDCVRADHLDGARGLTPALDALRAEGTAFRQAFSQSQNTLSSHLTLLGSCYLFQHGCYSNREVRELPEHALPRRLAAAGWAVEAFASVEFLARGLADQIGSFDRRYNHPSAPWWSRGWQRLRGYPSRIGGARTLRTGLRWLERQDPGRDAFLWLHAFDAHMVYTAPRRLLRAETGGTEAARRCREALREAGWHHTDYPAYDERVTPEHFPARYRAAVRHLDRELGEFVAALKDRGWWDDTLLVVTADHGECLLGDHGLYCMHQKLFDETVHVPLWIRFPGGEHAGREVDALVEHVDVAPTVLAAAGLAEPLFVGRDLAPLASGAAGAAPRRDVAFSEHVDRLLVAVRDREHVLVERGVGAGNPSGLPLERDTVFTRAGRPLAAGPARDAVERKLRAALGEVRTLERTRPEIGAAWSGGASVDDRIAMQLERLGYA